MFGYFFARPHLPRLLKEAMMICPECKRRHPEKAKIKENEQEEMNRVRDFLSDEEKLCDDSDCRQVAESKRNPMRSILDLLLFDVTFKRIKIIRIRG